MATLRAVGQTYWLRGYLFRHINCHVIRHIIHYGMLGAAAIVAALAQNAYANVELGQSPTLALGQRLFFEPNLSANRRYSCATCHIPSRQFTDGLAVAVGVFGDKLNRNTPTLLNARNFASFGWTNDGVTDLAEQHRQPLTNSAPVEMGLNAEGLRRLNSTVDLVDLRQAAFPASTGFDLDNVAQALAVYVASLEYQSAFDDYLEFDDASALSNKAKQGLALFTSQRLGCASCHQGPLLGGGWQEQGSVTLPAIYIKRTVAEGELQLRTPSLRAVRHTAPYMVDGRLPDFAAVIDFYEAGSANGLRPFKLTNAEREALLSFLNSL